MTDDERTQAEEMQEALKELQIARDYMGNHGYGTGTNFTFSSVVGLLTAYAALKVSEATKEMYPRSFVEWKDMYVQFYAYGNIYEVRSTDKHFVGLESLFEYWKKHKQ